MTPATTGSTSGHCRPASHTWASTPRSCRRTAILGVPTFINRSIGGPRCFRLPLKMRSLSTPTIGIDRFAIAVTRGTSLRFANCRRGNVRTTRSCPTFWETPDNPIPVMLEPGDVLAFSAQHLHASQFNKTNPARFNLECRTVCTGDIAAQRAAPQHRRRCATGRVGLVQTHHRRHPPPRPHEQVPI